MTAPNIMMSIKSAKIAKQPNVELSIIVHVFLNLLQNYYIKLPKHGSGTKKSAKKCVFK